MSENMENKKIRAYVEALFLDIEKTEQVLELKEELISNLSEKMNDYISEGYSENKAYTMVISNLGDIDELLQDYNKIKTKPYENTITNNDEDRELRKKIGIINAVGTGMYILSPVGLFQFGLTGLFLFIAIGVGLHIYAGAISPKRENDEEDIFPNPETRKLYNNISSIVWGLCTLGFFAIGFFQNGWAYAWIIFLVGKVIKNIVRIYLEK